MKKTMITITGSVLVFFGLLFILIPGPSLILLIPGLFLLSLEYSFARKWLKKAQKAMSKMAMAIDKFLLKRKYSR